MKTFVVRLSLLATVVSGLVGCAATTPPVPQPVALRASTKADVIGCVLLANGCSMRDARACLRDSNVGSKTYSHSGRCVPHQFAASSICSVVTSIDGKCVYDGPCVEVTPVGTTRPVSCSVDDLPSRPQ